MEKFPERKSEISSLFERAKVEGIESDAVEKAIKILEDSGAIKSAFDYGSELIQEKTLELTSILSDNKSGAREMLAEIFENIQR